MKPELRKYYEDRFEMFSSHGWKDLITDVKEMVKSTNTLSGVTVDNLKFKQGELSVMQWLLSIENISETAYQQLEGEE